MKFEKAFAKVSSLFTKERENWLPAGRVGMGEGTVFVQTQSCFGPAILKGILTRELLLPSLSERQMEVCLATSSTQLLSHLSEASPSWMSIR